MHFSTRFARTGSVAVVSLAGLLLAAGPAMAGQTPPPNSVNATATVPASLTLALSATSFSVTTPAGQSTDTTGGGITATVVTNNGPGYTIQEELFDSNGFEGRFVGTASGSHLIMGNFIAPYAYTAAGTLASAPVSGGFTNPGYMTLFNSPSPSAGSGDVFPLKWNFAPPSNQAPDSYTGLFGFLAAGN